MYFSFQSDIQLPAYHSISVNKQQAQTLQLAVKSYILWEAGDWLHSVVLVDVKSEVVRPGAWMTGAEFTTLKDKPPTLKG